MHISNKNNKGFINIILLLIIIGLLAFGFYYYKQQDTKECECEKQEMVVENAKKDWETTNLMGAYSFKYPSKWHVANIWPQDYSRPVTVAINPNPVDTTPRGGPLAEITILDKAGMKDPEAYLQERIDAIESYYSPYEKEVIDTDVGEIVHYKGTTNIYEEEYISEVYFVKLQGRINDSVNMHILEISRNPFSDKYSEVLEQIVLSLEKI